MKKSITPQKKKEKFENLPEKDDLFKKPRKKPVKSNKVDWKVKVGSLTGLVMGTMVLTAMYVSNYTTEFRMPILIQIQNPIVVEKRQLVKASEIIITPNPTPQPTKAPEVKLSESDYIEQAVNEFLPQYKSEALMIMHCLALRESRHGENKGHGDGGKAGGPFQFHQPTWNSMRKQMGEIPSSRYDFKESARTTAWALSEGEGKQWGPIYRKLRGSNYATCPIPSWNK